MKKAPICNEEEMKRWCIELIRNLHAQYMWIEVENELISLTMAPNAHVLEGTILYSNLGHNKESKAR